MGQISGDSSALHDLVPMALLVVAYEAANTTDHGLGVRPEPYITHRFC